MAGVAGCEPALGIDGRLAVAVGPQQHRAPKPDLVGGRVDGHLDPGQRPAVVDDAAAGLGQPVGGDHVGRNGGGGRRPAEHHGAEGRRRQPAAGRSAPATPARRVRRPPITASRSKRGSTVTGVPVSRLRVTTDRPPTWLSGRQASQRCRSGSTPRRALVGRAGRQHRGVGEDDAFGRAGGAAGRHDQGVAVVDREAARPGRRAVGRQDPGRPQAVQEHAPWPAPRAAGRAAARRRRRPRRPESAATRPVRRAGRLPPDPARPLVCAVYEPTGQSARPAIAGWPAPGPGPCRRRRCRWWSAPR